MIRTLLTHIRNWWLANFRMSEHDYNFLGVAFIALCLVFACWGFTAVIIAMTL